MELRARNLELHERCAGCDRISPIGLCGMYLEPAKLWTKLGGCAGRTHGILNKEEKKGFVDPLKASRKAAKGMAKLNKLAKKSEKAKKQERRDLR
jgi:hypothetical protein